MSNSALWMTSGRVADKGEKFVDHRREHRLVPERFGGVAVHARRLLGDVALRD